MMINKIKILPENSLENSKFLSMLDCSKTSVGNLYRMHENDVRANKNASAQGYWFLLFLEMIEPIVESLKFLELRPVVIGD